jgi:5-methyltetrahydrofolate--homocysteine methyltransferase
MDIKEIVKKRVLVGDGAMGSMLIQKGFKSYECPEEWNITNRDAVKSIHKEYIDAGSELIITNTLGGNYIKLKKFNKEKKLKDINHYSVDLAREVAKEEALVLGDIGPTGEFIAPLGTLKPSDVYEVFCEQIAALIEGGVDGLIIETMTAFEEMEMAIKAVKDNTSLPLIASFSFNKDKNGFRTMMGVDIARALELLEKKEVDIIGTNCGCEVSDMIDLVSEIRKVASKPLMAQPNAGQPELKDGRTSYKMEMKDMANEAIRLKEAGANIIGGCCGTTPEYIKWLRELL